MTAIEQRKKLSPLRIAPYLFIAPAIIYVFCVTIIPILMALPISFTDWSAYTPKRSFVGLDNYKRLFTDADFAKSLIVTGKFLLFVPLVMIAGLAAACLLNTSVKGIKFFRVVFYAPVITSTVAAAVLFEWFYQPAFGLFNNILRSIGLQGIGWVTDVSTSVLSVMIFKICLFILRDYKMYQPKLKRRHLWTEQLVGRRLNTLLFLCCVLHISIC